MRRILLISIAALLMAGAAGAADLYTAPFYVGSNDIIGCKVLNVSSSTKTLQIQIVKGDGSVLSDSGEITLAAGNTVSNFSAAGVLDQTHCHFIVKGKKANVRASAVRVNGGLDVVVVPAS